MYMRLGFAVAIHVDPDVLLVDEVLAVGDEGFTHKCLDKFGEFKRRGKTILLVTHSLNLVERFCDEALWLDGGKVRGSGDPKRVVGAYLTDVGKSEEKELARTEARAQEDAVSRSQTPASSVQSPDPPDRLRPLEDMTRVDEGRWGSREIEITGVTLQDRAGRGVAHLPVRRSDVDSPECARASADRRLRLRHRHLQRRRGQLLRHQHAPRGLHAAGMPAAKEKSRSGSRASISSKAPTSSMSPSTSATDIRTTITGCCTRSA